MIETGRVPQAAPKDEPKAYPPEQPVPALPPIFGPPPIHIPPVIPPEEPPIDVPEPGLLIILMTGAFVYWRFLRPGLR